MLSNTLKPKHTHKRDMISSICRHISSTSSSIHTGIFTDTKCTALYRSLLFISLRQQRLTIWTKPILKTSVEPVMACQPNNCRNVLIMTDNSKIVNMSERTRHTVPQSGPDQIKGRQDHMTSLADSRPSSSTANNKDTKTRTKGQGIRGCFWF